MPKLKPSSEQLITNVLCDRLAKGKPDAIKNEIIRDTQQSGFGIAVGRTRCSFFIEGRIGRGGKTTRHTLGTVGQLPLDTPKGSEIKGARQLAKDAWAKLGGGVDLTKEHREKVAKRVAIDRAMITVREAFDLAMAGNISERTKQDYHEDCERIGWNNRKIAELTAKEIGKKFIELGAGASASRIMRGLRRAWYCAGDDDENMPKFPSKGLKTAKSDWNAPDRKITSISDVVLPDFMRAVAALSDARLRDTIMFSFYTGCRPCEVAKLKIEHVDLKSEVYTLVHTKVKKKNITLPMTAQTKAILARCVKNPEDRVLRGEPKSGRLSKRPLGEGFVFTWLEGHRNDAEVVALKKIATFAPNDFRRGFITNTYEAGVPGPFARSLTGHKIPKTDAHEGYIYRDPNKLRPHAQKTHDHLDRLAGIHPKLKLVA